MTARSKLRAVVIESNLGYGKYKSVLTSAGSMREHGGQTDPMEFFAEMTESNLGSYDFYPFGAGELEKVAPKIHTRIAETWGDLPRRTNSKRETK